MGQALYRKHRSKKLSEIVGQEHITDALEQALKTDKISHAYLFTGPRGIGKTSIARILAHEVNQLSYDETTTHIDIIEIDAASNRRIDEIRDLRDKIYIAPTSTKYKVYIIDEVHMLTREAFNALLKTLEEPPAHAIFILATTEVHKLPETIISRTQHFTFRPIEVERATEHLASIAKKENITIEPDALRLVAEHGNGSFRDSISILDQVSSHSEAIQLADVERLIGVAPKQNIAELNTALRSKDAKTIINVLQNLKQQGIAPTILAKQLAQNIRDQIAQAQSPSPKEDLALLQELITVSQSPDPYSTLEVILLQYVFLEHKSVANNDGAPSSSTSPPPAKPNPDTKPSTPPTQKPSDTKKPSNPEKQSKPEASVDTPSMAETPAEPEDTSAASETKVIAQVDNQALDASVWPSVLDTIKKKYNTLYGVLRMAEPDFSNGTITLYLSFAFHQKRLNEPKNKQIVADAITAITGQNPEIICMVKTKDTVVKASKSAGTTEESPSIGAISNIFGGAELLES